MTNKYVVRKAFVLCIALLHANSFAALADCDPDLSEAIEQRRGSSDKQIDGVDEDISSSGQKLLECMIDFSEVVGKSITVGGMSIDISDLVGKLNQEACNMTKQASQGRLPTLPSARDAVSSAVKPPYLPTTPQSYTPSM